MKNIKRVFSLMTVVMMVFCLNVFSVNVSASEYKITIHKPASSDVSIAGQTFNAYKVFSLSYSGTNYSYTADSTCLDADYSEVASSVGASDAAGILTALSGADKDANARKFADAVYKQYIQGKSPAIVGTAIADANSAVIDVNEPGYFLVFGTGTDGNSTTVTSLVMLGTTDTTAEITAKVDAPTITKEIKHNETDSWGNVGDNQIGDTVEYRFVSDIPYNVANFTSYDYIIHDTLSAGLTFNNDVAVYKDAAKANQLADTYVTVNSNPSAPDSFTVTIDVLGAVTAGDLLATDTLYTYYSANLNTSALAAGTAPDSTNHNDNAVYLEYSNNPYDTTTGQTTTTQVYDWTFSFTVNKVDSESNPLANAVFNIKEGENILKFSNAGSNVYVLDPGGSEDITTDLTGKFVIKGLDDNTEYKLCEKTPPAGFNKAEDTVFRIQSGYGAGNELTSLSATIGGNAGQPLSVDVVNKSGSELVGTGGIGTTIFYVSGGILMVVAVVLLITKKRMNK